MISLSRGFTNYFSGLKFWMNTRSLLGLSLFPMIINIILFAAGFSFAITKIPEAVAYVVQKPELWYQYVLYYIVLILTALTFFILTLFVVAVVSNFIAFPFNDKLAEKTLTLHGVLDSKNEGIKGWLSGSVKNFTAMFKKLLFLLIAGCILLFATLIPGLGLVAGLIGVSLITFDILDYSFDHFHMSFQERMHFMRGNKLEIIGFTFAIGLTTAIPVLNMLMLPGSVVSGARFVAQIKKRSPSIERSYS
ncbi:MAG: EI24 domain-containing protein [Oligoflexia bacterium]|nr:EI24 domain-containing protein [Oligoflexia bacterium]